MRSKMRPAATVSVSRQFQAGYSDAANAGIVRPDQDRARTRDDSQQLEHEPWHNSRLALHHHRNATDNSVALNANAEQPAAGRGPLEAREVAQQVREGDQIVAGIRPEDSEPGDRQWLASRFLRDVRSRLPQDDPAARDCLGQDIVIAWQATKAITSNLVEIARVPCELGWRRAVRFRKNDIKANRDALHLGQTGQYVGDQGARPWPLSICADAFLIDVDDDNG